MKEIHTVVRSCRKDDDKRRGSLREGGVVALCLLVGLLAVGRLPADSVPGIEEDQPFTPPLSELQFAPQTPPGGVVQGPGPIQMDPCTNTCDGYLAFPSDNCECPNDYYERLKFFMRHLHGINLNAQQYAGWENEEYYYGYTHGRNATQRMVIASAQIIKYWVENDLYNNAYLRDQAINTYTAGHGGAWCSEFVSYLYRFAGIPLAEGDLDFWCHSSHTLLKDYFHDREYYHDFDTHGRWEYEPQIGDYLKMNSHSLMVLGSLKTNNVWDGRVFVIHGNSGNAVTTGIYHIENPEIRGLGILEWNRPYVIVFVHSGFGGYNRLLKTDVANFQDVWVPDNPLMGNFNDRISSAFLANGAMATFWVHHNYGGDSVTFDNSSWYVGDPWNDQLSSMDILNGW